MITSLNKSIISVPGNAGFSSSELSFQKIHFFGDQGALNLFFFFLHYFSCKDSIYQMKEIQRAFVGPVYLLTNTVLPFKQF